VPSGAKVDGTAAICGDGIVGITGEAVDMVGCLGKPWAERVDETFLASEERLVFGVHRSRARSAFVQAPKNRCGDDDFSNRRLVDAGRPRAEDALHCNHDLEQDDADDGQDD
jgi:hypothetical protein